METAPLFSVIVPTRDRPERLARCLDSLRAQRCAGGFEIIVVDDGSKIPLSAGGGVKLVSSGGAGPGLARNAGAREARGSILAFIDDDCLAPPGWLGALAEIFRSEPGASAVGGGVRLGFGGFWAAANGFLAKNTGCPHRYEGFEFLPFATPITANFALRREAFDAVGGFRAEYSFLGDDTGLFYDLRRAGREVLFRPECFVEHPLGRKLLPVLWKKCYRYGRVDAIMLRGFFRGTVCAEAGFYGPGARCVKFLSVRKSPVTVYLRLDAAKAVLAAAVFFCLLPAAGKAVGAAALIAAAAVAAARARGFFAYTLVQGLAGLFVAAGRLRQSVKEKVFCF